MTTIVGMAVTKRKIAKITTASAMTPNLLVPMPNVSPKIINVMERMIVETIVMRLIVMPTTRLAQKTNFNAKRLVLYNLEIKSAYLTIWYVTKRTTVQMEVMSLFIVGSTNVLVFKIMDVITDASTPRKVSDVNVILDLNSCWMERLVKT
jgi:hypothetical protein